MADPINNTDDVIDSRDVIERIEELEGDLEGSYDALCETFETFREQHNDLLDDEKSGDSVETDFIKWLAEQDDCPDEEDITLYTKGVLDGKSFEEWLTYLRDVKVDSDASELLALKALQEEAEGYAPDWHYGTTLIRDSYFEDYARELAEECGYIKRDVGWPYTCIDWEQAAKELQIDYTTVEFDGVTYWVR